MLGPSTRLGAIPIVLAAAAAILMIRPWSSFSAKAMAAGAVACALALIGTDVGAVVNGSGARLSVPRPLDGVDVGLLATPAGYSILGLSLIAALVALTWPQRNRQECAFLLLGVAGVSLACLSEGLFGIVAGGQVVWFATWGAAESRGTISLERWLGLITVELGLLCLTGALVWLQTAAGTSAFNSVPASTATAASAVWAAGLLLVSMAAGMGRARDGAGDIDVGVTLLLPLVVIGLVRLLETATPLSPGGGAVLVIGGAGLGALAALRTLGERRLPSTARWIWVSAFAPILIFSGINAAGTGEVIACAALAATMSGLALEMSVRNGVGGALRAVCIMTATALPTGISLLTSVLGFAVLQTSKVPKVLSWVFLITAVLVALGGIRAAVSRLGENYVQRGPAAVAAAVLTAAALMTFMPGTLSATVLAWLVDASVPSSTGLSVRLAGSGTWPGGYIALLCVLLVTAAVCVMYITGTRPRLASRVYRGGAARSPLAVWEKVRPWAQAVGRGGTRVDEWSFTQPRLAVIVICGAIILLVLR